MATLEQKIIEAFTKQNRQFLEEMQKMVRVTMLEPYDHNESGTVTMRYGSTPATVVGQSNSDSDDEVIDMTQRPRKIIPGRPQHYHMHFEGIKGMKCQGPNGCQDEPFDIDKTIIMPLPAAMIYFGSWLKFNKVWGPGEQPDTYDTIQHQEKLVAACWGGYQKRIRSQANYVPNDWRSLESVGAPAVPKVSIVRLDTQLRKIPNSEFIPWETYDFMSKVVPDRWSENPNDRIMQVTEAGFQEAVAAAVAKALAAERGNNMPQKARA